MHTEFRKVELPRELRSLVAFDRRVFAAEDAFDAHMWKACDAYWMLVDGKKTGCCGFMPHRDLFGNPDEGSLYIVSTGILPKYQHQGLGRLMKSWQIAYARHHGFARILTNMRERNTVMIALNRKHHFRVVRRIPEYYSNPTEATVVMQLLLR